MNIAILVLLSAGLAALLVGAELFVRAAARLAALLGISPLVVGLTVVALGTSSPEIAVSVQSSFEGRTDIALGNIIGSNIFNVLLILGLAAMITPLVVAQRLVRLDVPVMIGASVFALLFALDGHIGAAEGLVFLATAVAYTVFLILQSRRETPEIREEYAREYGKPPASRWLANLGAIAAGLVLLVLGSRWLVEGAVAIAVYLGASELVVSLTIIAAGTSLPEVATSVIASLRGQRDIAVGNVVGSNIFNVLAVLGLAGVLAPAGIPVSQAVLGFDLPIMIAVAVACLPIFFTGNLIARWEGLLFFAYYCTYTAYLILRSAEHDALPLFNAIMLAFVLPLTAVTLAILAWRARHAISMVR